MFKVTEEIRTTSSEFLTFDQLESNSTEKTDSSLSLSPDGYCLRILKKSFTHSSCSAPLIEVGSMVIQHELEFLRIEIKEHRKTPSHNVLHPGIPGSTRFST